MGKKTIAVLFGGVSSEHDVSRVSATSVIRNIPRDKYDVVTVGITKDGRWLLYSGDVEMLADGSWENDKNNCTSFLSPDPTIDGLVVLKDGKCEVLHIDAVFPVLHGKNGEDGTVQGLFQLCNIPFVGCDLLSSATCMDKVSTNILLEHAGIAQAGFTWLYSFDYKDKREQIIDEIKNKLGGFPVFVKPASAGSSVGVSKVHSVEELDESIAKASHEDRRIVIEEGIVGQEVECAVLGNEHPRASIVGEIETGAEFYDYEDKYVNGTSKLHIPARLSEEKIAEIQQEAVRAYQALGCGGLSRVDFFVRTSDGKVMLNEINTLPGFTSISMYPKLWDYSGISYGELLDKLIEFAFKRNAGEID